jgi:hypothetical protein
MVHLDVSDAWDSTESTSTLNFRDSVQDQKVSLDEQYQSVALPGASPKGMP